MSDNTEKLIGLGLVIALLVFIALVPLTAKADTQYCNNYNNGFSSCNTYHNDSNTNTQDYYYNNNQSNDNNNNNSTNNDNSDDY